MSWFWLFVIVVIAFALLVTFKKAGEGQRGGLGFPYQRGRPLFSAAERSFLQERGQERGQQERGQVHFLFLAGRYQIVTPSEFWSRHGGSEAGSADPVSRCLFLSSWWRHKLPAHSSRVRKLALPPAAVVSMVTVFSVAKRGR